MPVSKNSLNHCTIIYHLDEVKKTFRQYRKQTKENLLPDLIRIEKNNGYNTFSGCNNLLRLHDKSNWYACTILSLKPVGIKDFYYANVFADDIKTLCIISSSKENHNIKLYIFPSFCLHVKTESKEKIIEIIQSILL